MILRFYVCGLACIISAFLEDENPGKIGLVLIGKMGASAAFSTAWVFTAELFPTPVRYVKTTKLYPNNIRIFINRGTGVGVASMIGRLASTAAPQISVYLPAITFQVLINLTIMRWHGC